MHKRIVLIPKKFSEVNSTKQEI